MTATTMLGSGHDEHGNPISGPADAIGLYDRAVDRLLRYKPEVVEIATTLAEEHSAVPMTSALMAYLNLASTDERDVAVAVSASEAMAGTQMNERERAHQRAIGAWVSGDWTGAAPALDRSVRAVADRPARADPRAPARLLPRRRRRTCATARSRRARARPGRIPTRPFVRGMTAFGLEESGSYEQAEDAGLAAVAANPDDVWAIHAVVHTLRDAGAGRRGHRASSARRDPTGSPATCSPSTTGGTSRCTSWRPAAGAGAGDLRRRDPPRRVARRADRDARRQRPAVADAPRRRRHRRSVRAAGRRVGDVRSTPGPGTCSTTCTPRWRSPAPAGSATSSDG